MARKFGVLLLFFLSSVSECYPNQDIDFAKVGTVAGLLQRFLHVALMLHTGLRFIYSHLK